MRKKISFHGMDHSAPLEDHANEKLQKIIDLIEHSQRDNPMAVELTLEGHRPHPHHKVTLHVKTPEFDLYAHEENPDMYVALDTTIDTMVRLINKEKGKLHDKHRRADSPKKEFVRFPRIGSADEEDNLPTFDEDEE
jgi:ribosomal subunit interface protein